MDFKAELTSNECQNFKEIVKMNRNLLNGSHLETKTYKIDD